MTKSNVCYLYNLNFYAYDEPLCAIELKYLFEMQLDEKVFFSSVKVEPSVSPFIKNRLEILFEGEDLQDLKSFTSCYTFEETDYDVKYIKLKSGDTNAEKRNSLCKSIAEGINHPRNIREPQGLYGVTQFKGTWYFGKLARNDYKWRAHNNRPYTYSNSLKIHLAKVLINIAGTGDTKKTIVDPCCGAGTVLLEGAYAGYQMTGSDISRKTSWNALRNLKHFGYDVPITHKAIEDIKEHYDSCIIDLPYGLYSQTSPEAQASIIRNAKRIAERVVIVSSEDISKMIEAEGLEVLDVCKLIKTINRDFTRYIWVCK